MHTYEDMIMGTCECCDCLAEPYEASQEEVSAYLEALHRRESSCSGY